MNPRTLFTINVPISALFGVTCMLVPNWFLSLYGVDLAPAIASVLAQVAGVFNALGWSTVAVYLFLVVGYGYFRFLKPEIVPVR